MKTKFIQLILCIALFASTNLFSYEGKDKSFFRFDEELFSIHPKIGINYDYYLVDFSGFYGSVDCGLFEKGFGWGIPLSLNLEKYWNKLLYTELQFGFNYGFGHLIQELKFPMRDLNTGNVVQVTTENRVDMDLGFIEINPGVGYNFIDHGNYISRLVGGLRLSIPIIKDFEQKEIITSPESAVFTNINDIRTKERPLASGKITTANNPIIAIYTGIEALTEKFGSYKISFGYNLNDFTQDGAWKAISMRLEVGYRMPIWIIKEEPVKIIEKPVEAIPVIVEEKKKPEPKINIRNIQVDGKIEIGNELLSSLPIVNNVFFETNSSELNTTYNLSGNGIDEFSGDAVGIHRNVLSRMAQIIKKNPNASIVLQASTSGETNEPAGLELAKQRAESVRNALLSLGVNSSKIKLEPLVNPKNPSNQDFDEGKLENQRVEIILRNASLQEYVDIQKYANFKGKLKFDAMLLDTEGDKVEVRNNLNSQTLEIFKSGTYEIPLDYRLEDNFSEKEIAVYYSFREQEQIAESKIDYKSFNQEQVDLNLDNFLAILRFDYNISSISEENKELLKQLSTKLPTGATIQILGSTDELGTPQRNAILAKERAENTRNFIQTISKDKFIIEIGTNFEKFPEATPQGRFLNRSIRIKVKK